MPSYDGNGNIASLINLGSGALAAAFEYSPFGEMLRDEILDNTVATSAFGFSTKWRDVETGWLNYGRRYYDPRNGRFIGRDPIAEKGGINLYAFCGNNSINRWDRLGMHLYCVEVYEGEYLCPDDYHGYDGIPEDNDVTGPYGTDPSQYFGTYVFAIHSDGTDNFTNWIGYSDSLHFNVFDSRVDDPIEVPVPDDEYDEYTYRYGYFEDYAGNPPTVDPPDRKPTLRYIVEGEFNLSVYDDVFVDEKKLGLLDRLDFKRMATKYAGEKPVFAAADNRNLVRIVQDFAEKSVDGFVYSIAMYTHGESGKSPGVNQVQMTNEDWKMLNGLVMNLYLFGCLLAMGEEGQTKMQEIANITGATVWASPHLISEKNGELLNPGVTDPGSVELIPFVPNRPR